MQPGASFQAAHGPNAKGRVTVSGSGPKGVGKGRGRATVQPGGLGPQIPTTGPPVSAPGRPSSFTPGGGNQTVVAQALNLASAPAEQLASTS